jgi:hypothetical protein
MPRSHPHGGSTPDPLRQRLAAVRQALLELHKALLDAERAEFERGHASLTPAQLLQAVIHDPWFAWLRPASALVVQMDELLSPRRAPIAPEVARTLLDELRALVAPSEAAVGFGVRALEVRRRARPAEEAFARLARLLVQEGG